MYIKRKKIDNPHPWVREQAFSRVADAVKQIGGDLRKPIFDLLGGEMTYNQIRISLACLSTER